MGATSDTKPFLFFRVERIRQPGLSSSALGVHGSPVVMRAGARRSMCHAHTIFEHQVLYTLLTNYGTRQHDRDDGQGRVPAPIRSFS